MYTGSLLKGRVQNNMHSSDNTASLSVAHIKNMSMVYF